MILHKLRRYRQGGVSERQWTDVLGVLRVMGPVLDQVCLAHWASDLGVGDLLERALREAAPAQDAGEDPIAET